MPGYAGELEAATIGSRSMLYSVGSADTLQHLDVDHTGTFTIADVERSIKNLHVLTRATQVMAVSVVVVLIVTFMTACASVELAKELRVTEGFLLAADGSVVTSQQKHRRVDVGMSSEIIIPPENGGRRLATTTRRISLNYTYFKSQADLYMAGEIGSLMVIKLSEEEYRTANIGSCSDLGNPRSCSGVCGGMCDGKYSWYLTCLDDRLMCYGNVTIFLPEEPSRLLLGRASYMRNATESEFDSLDLSMSSRRLQTKAC
mmetsp:Transcript_40505/g.88551  ORF Transcript_40505/g.88551 Transcript_40505/m.88551 type:complete len:259 (-) Transcript_40505:509-1285(-)